MAPKARTVELVILFSFFSGIVLWDLLPVPLEIGRHLLFWHAPAALLLFALYLFPYISSHLAYHLPTLKKASVFQRRAGMTLGMMLMINILSGIYLMFFGRRGDMIGETAYYLHFVSSFAVVVVLMLHSTFLRFTLQKTSKLIGLVVIIFSFTPPADAGDSMPSVSLKDKNTSVSRGEILFYSTDKSGVPGLSMGDGTQSCGSCHKRGFNESNNLLFKNAKIDPKKSAVVGHKNLKHFFAKDFVEDYISAIIEQGGSVKNPQKPSPEIIKAMGELHLFIRSRSNLPFFSTWVRLDENTTHYHPKEWTNSAACKSCHPEIFDQWANSNHRLMGGSNPYYIALEDLAAKEEGEGIRFWCMGCHSPGVLTSGGRQTSKASHLFDKNGQALVERMNKGIKEPEEGTSCLFCHRITKLEEVRGNGGYTLNLRDRPKYLFEERKGAFGAVHEAMINSKPKLHAQSYSKEIYRSSKYCMSCHDEFAPGSGVKIVDTYGEWERSDYNHGSGNPKTKECIDCHMNPSPSDLDQKIPGRSTVGGTLKKSVKTHHFAGSNHFLSGLRSAEHEKMTLDLLKSSAKIEMKLSQQGLNVRVTNVGAGHHLPTGVSDFRELWLEVTLKDALGKVILSSGRIDNSGEIEPGSRLFRKVFADRSGVPVGLKFWKYEKLLEDTRIPAKGFRDEHYLLPSALSYPLTTEVKLKFRIYPQWVTTVVQKEFPQLPTPPAVTLQTLTQTWKQP